MSIKAKKLAWKRCPPIEYVRKWELVARGPAAELYDRHPGTGQLTRSHLNRLYVLWQDRSRLLARERKDVQSLSRVLPSLNSFRALHHQNEADVLDLYEVLTRAVGRRFSLKVFALHASHPRIFPPLSPARLAAYYVLTEGTPADLPAFSEALLPTYFTYQKSFFDLVKAAAADSSRVDKALLALGQLWEIYHPVLAGSLDPEKVPYLHPQDPTDPKPPSRF